VRRAAEEGLGRGTFRGHELSYDGRHALVYDDEDGARALAEELGMLGGFKTSRMRRAPGSFSLVPVPEG
jgi:hypothetical protein